MGNSIIVGRKKAKIMKINGESFKLKTPSIARDVLMYYPGHVLMESEAVKRFGIRAKPLDQQQHLQPKKVYFLIELPNFPDERVPRRSRSVVQRSAKDRLESLKLRRSASDTSGSKQISGPFQVKMKLPRSQVQKMMDESKDNAEVAEKILDFCLHKNSKVEEEGSPG